MWADDNLRNYPYLLVNPISGPDGSQQAAGPVAYTKSPTIPPAMAALLQITESDMQEILGASQQADKMVSNTSGKAVELIQTRLDMQTFIYMTNFAKAMKRCGEVWLSMAKEVYVEEGRKMKGISPNGDPMQIELMKPMITDTGEMALSNDLSGAKLDVNVEVGPSSSSKRAATVRALTGMMAITQDAETQQVLQAMAMMNMEGEGIGDVRDYFRMRLVKMGVIKPTDEEAQEMMIELQGQPQDPNAVFLQAAAEEAQAKAAKARADVVNTVADAELTQAKTLETLAKVGGEVGGAMQPQSGAMQATPQIDQKTALEIEAMMLENQLRRNRVESTDGQIEQLRAERQANDSMVQASEVMQQAVAGIGQTVAVIGEAVGKMSEAVGQFAEASSRNTDKAIEALNKPKRVVREKGRVVGIE
jgi:hypothetical protein